MKKQCLTQSLRLAKATSGKVDKHQVQGTDPGLARLKPVVGDSVRDAAGAGPPSRNPSAAGSGFRPRRALPAEGLSRGTRHGRGRHGGPAAKAMDNHSLDEFRRRWQEELVQAQALRKRRRPEAAERRSRRPEVAPGRGEQASGYLALAQGLLEGASRPPAAQATRAQRQDSASRSRSPPARDGAGGAEQLVDQLIRDLVSGLRLLPRPAPGATPQDSLPESWKVCHQWGEKNA